MKKIFIAIISIIIILTTTITVFATESIMPIDTDEEIVKIGYLKNYGIIDEPIIRGSRGFGFEFFNEISKHTKYKYEYVQVEWQEGLDMLKNGEIDIFGPADKTADRELIYDFIPKPFGYEDIAVYSIENSGYAFGDVQALNGSKIGATVGLGFQKEIEDYITKNNLDVEIVHTPDINFASRIKNGEIDFALSGALFKQEGLEIVDIIDSKPFYFMTSKGNTKLVEEISTALNDIEKTKKGYMYTLYNKYYGDVPYADQNLTEDEVSALREKDVYTVGYHCDWKPLSYTNEDGEAKGFAVETMNEFARQLGIKIKYVPLHGEVYYDVDSLDFNLCMGEDECIDHGQLSEPYVYLDTAVLSMSDIKTCADIKSIVAMDYSTLEIEKYLGSYTNAEIHFAHSGAESIQIIKDYGVDCIIALEPRVQMMLNNDPLNDYEVTFLDTNTPLGIAVSYNLPHEVYTALDKIIVGMDKTLLGKNIAKSLSELQKDVSLVVFLNEYGYYIGTAVALLVFAFIFINLRLVVKNEKKLKNLVEVDQITGLMTMTKMMPEMIKLLANAKPKEYYILSFDIDNFKLINQTYGFEKGNELLCAITRIMTKNASKDTLMCRLHNDIFIMFGKRENIPNADNPKLMISQEICDEIMKSVEINSPLHLSVGFYLIEDNYISPEKMTDTIRNARLLSKSKHGNSITIYSEELKLQTEKEQEIYNSMEQALRDREFFIVVQPKVELETGKLVGGEVLVRWKKADGTFVCPDQFIPLFEKNSFIVNLDTYVFEEACRFVKNAKAKLPHLSVNISPMTALDENIVETYLDILERYGLKAEQFEIELIESALDMEFDKIFEVVSRLRECGFILSIDDFGKGASSLARIQNVDVDVIKLDKGFIDNNFNTEKGNAVIANAIELANSLGITTLAEGIETKEQHKMLLELGCDLGQGYFFDMPLSTDEFMSRAVEDSKKEYPIVMKSSEKIKTYLSDFENLPYGIAFVKNNLEFTIIKANNKFFDMIGYSKESLLRLHNNEFKGILVDDFYPMVQESLKRKEYLFDLELEICTENGETVWLHDIGEYDEKTDTFILTLMDITDRQFVNKGKLSFIAYQAKKESLFYTNSLVSDFIVVVDAITEKIIYMNDKALNALGFTSEEDWEGKLYSELTNTDPTLYSDYYKTVLERGYGSREYYNEFLEMYIHNEYKIFEVMGRKMRLNIITDITAKKKQESEYSIQLALKQCIEYLYTTTTTTTTFAKMLEQLRMYYYADRAYYFTFSEEKHLVSNDHEVVREGVKSQMIDLQELSTDVFVPVHQKFERGNAMRIDAKDLALDASSKELLRLFEEGEITHAILAPIQNLEGDIIGVIGVDNPMENADNLELMNRLTKYVWMFIKSISTKVLEKEALQLEELSTVATLEKTATLLQGYENTDERITEVLSLLRNHYNASNVTLFSIDKEKSTYSTTHESCANGALSKFDETQNVPIASMEEWTRPYKNGAQFVSGSIDDMPIGSPQRDNWEKFGIQNVIIAPLFDKNNEISSFISVNNRSYTTRNQTLTCIIAKSISDYREKLLLEKRYAEEIVLDPLTNLLNKMATQNIISRKLDDGIMGVLFIIDIDHFKNLNDTLGHSVGDIVLVEIANEIKGTFRNSDVVGRIGGDEFMVFCPNPIADALVLTKAKSICKNCNKVYKKDDQFAEISASVGILRIDGKVKTFEGVYEQVDKALYTAKKNGRNQFCVASEDV